MACGTKKGSCGTTKNSSGGAKKGTKKKGCKK